MKAEKNSKTIAVMFGGRSAEHEISIITALQAITAIDTLRYRIVPIYIHPNGRWYTGERLLDKAFYKKMPEALSKLQQVTLLPDPLIGGLMRIGAAWGSKESIIPIDVYFLAFHGQYGEDGCIQGLLEMADAAYTGSNVIASAVAMNKYLCKLLVGSHGIPTLPSILVKRKEAPQSLDDVEKIIGANPFPVFVKPCHLGSSIGISIANDPLELHGALAKVFRYDNEALIEPCITQLMEINVAVLDGRPPRASVVELPIPSAQMLTYEDKYLRGGKKTRSPQESQGMASLPRIIDPQNLDPLIKERVMEYALTVFSLLGCSGAGRFDFMVDLSKGQLYFNELNPLPGSLAFYLWEKSNPSLLYTELLDHCIAQAEERRNAKLALQHDIGFKAIS